MASAPRNHYSISIGGDAHGPVVAGDDNRVEAAARDAAPLHADDGTPAPTGPSQSNVAKDHASLYTVMNGELHIHQETPGGDGNQRGS
ncbi:hypothetical protein E1265_28270 [Streptomyces sp. 8K308]|nr:hypothetical protein E1265_28270 [Streptomyces sp. 8K308]